VSFAPTGSTVRREARGYHPPRPGRRSIRTI